MAIQLGRAVLTVLAGLFVGGLFAAVAVVAAPPEWRGPWIPVLAGAAGIALAALVRRLGASPSDGTTGRPPYD